MALVMVMSSGTFWYLAPQWFQTLAAMMKSAIASPTLSALGQESIPQFCQSIGWTLFELVGPIAIVAVSGAVLSNMVQAGWIWTPAQLSPRTHWGFGNPLQRAAHAVWRCLEATVLALICWRFWSCHQQVIASLGQGELLPMLVIPSKLLGELCFQLSLAISFMSVGDYFVRFWRNEQSLKMTFEERRRELQEDAVDPRFRQARQKPTGRLAEIERL